MLRKYDVQMFRAYNRFLSLSLSFNSYQHFLAIFVAMFTLGIGSKGPTEETLLLNGMLDFPIGLS